MKGSQEAEAAPGARGAGGGGAPGLVQLLFILRALGSPPQSSDGEERASGLRLEGSSELRANAMFSSNQAGKILIVSAYFLHLVFPRLLSTRGHAKVRRGFCVICLERQAGGPPVMLYICLFIQHVLGAIIFIWFLFEAFMACQVLY